METDRFVVPTLLQSQVSISPTALQNASNHPQPSPVTWEFEPFFAPNRSRHSMAVLKSSFKASVLVLLSAELSF